MAAFAGLLAAASAFWLLSGRSSRFGGAFGATEAIH
jgi:hypothetical protein